jgi:transposase
MEVCDADQDGQLAARLRRPGAAPLGSRPHVRPGRQPSRGRPHLWGLRPGRQRLVPPLAPGRRASAAGRAGRRPRLSAAELDAVEEALGKGPQAFGFDTDLWTLGRIAAVIEQLTGVRHHPGHVWRLLRRLGWSPQRPARRAAERDEAEIARWRAQEWPRIKGGR